MPQVLPRLLLLLLFAAGSFGAAAQEALRPELARHIDSLWYGHRGGDSAINADVVRNREVRQILETVGYPGVPVIGAESCEHFWNLLQRADSDPALQRLALSLVRQAVADCTVPGRHLAWLQDRVLVNAGQRQRYGTQLRLNADSSSFEPRPLEDPKALDTRRATLGLPPMAEYIELMNRRYREMLKPKE